MVAITKKLTLDMKDIPERRRRDAKKAVLNIIENETTRALSRGRSPVKGEVFPKLNKEYADQFKLGDTTPNLQLEGDLLQAIEYNVLSGDDISWGYSDGSTEADKADGHNQFSPASKKAIWANGNPKLDKRRYIPESNQDLKPSITKLMNLELDKFRKINIPTERALDIETVGDEEITSIDIGGSIFSDETIISEILREFANGTS